MKRTIILVLALAAALIGCTNAPTATQADQIRMACAADAAIRPTVDVLLAVPGLAKAEEVAAVVAARAIITPVCKDPAAPVSGDPYAAVSQASATVAGILVQIQTRKAAAK